jgi:Zincin-like metallopeptidase
MAFALPRTLTLPSGARVTLRRASSAALSAARRDEGAPLFSEVLALFDRDVSVVKGRTSVDVRDLPVSDFHVIRAFLVKAGLVHEDDFEIECHNCGEPLTTRPCQGLETGPWEDGELGDSELDHTAELGVPLETSPVRLGRVRQATTITLAPRTVREAMPFWAALAREPFVFDADVVRAIGVEALGPIRDPATIARALARDEASGLAAVADAFLPAHYPLRLACDVFCPACKARNTVDAPAERELELEGGGEPDEDEDEDEDEDQHEHGPLPPLEEFVEIAHAMADPLIAEIPGEKVVLIVEPGTPAVDEGGEPLLGSYVPPPPADAPVPTQPPTVTIYYETFARIEREEGPFDWEAELDETLRHELEHHVFHLRGDDPMDEEEHAEIDREALRVIGRGEATRRSLAVFGLSIPDFLRRAWPLVLIGALALAISLVEGRCT